MVFVEVRGAHGAVVDEVGGAGVLGEVVVRPSGGVVCHGLVAGSVALDVILIEGLWQHLLLGSAASLGSH